MRSLEEGTLTQSSKTPTQLLLLPALRTAELTTYQCLWFPTRPLGILPPQWSRAPLETQLSLPARSRRRLALTRTRTRTHPRTPYPLPPLQQPQGKREGSLGAHKELAATPSQGKNHSLFCYSHHNTETWARRTTWSLANTTSKLLSHNHLTVFQPFQADQPGVRSRLAFTSLSLVFSFIVFGLDRISIAIRKGSV